MQGGSREGGGGKEGAGLAGRVPGSPRPHMLRFVFFRLLQSLIALAILSVVVFVLARATGDPLHMILPMNASEEDYANARPYLALDRPSVAHSLSSVAPPAT